MCRSRSRQSERGPLATHRPGISICSYYHLHEVIQQAHSVISILGSSDRLTFPDVGDRPVLRLAFDDVTQARKGLIEPTEHHIDELIQFTRSWNCSGTLLIHCRAGSGRSPAAGMIAAFALGQPDCAAQLRAGRSYFTPNQTMLRLADARLGLEPKLVELTRSIPASGRKDRWAPIWIPL